MTHDTGDQAFPMAWGNHEQGGDYIRGMTLRDWFAGQALIGEVSSQSFEDGWINTDEAKRDAAKKCYQLADAMLEARK